MVTTATANVSLRPDGIVKITINHGVKQRMPDAQENLAAILRIAPPPPAGVIIDMSGALPLDPEVRHFYAEAPLGGVYRAAAFIIAGSPLGRMMGNVYLRIARHAIPVKLFTDEASAVAWLGERCKHG